MRFDELQPGDLMVWGEGSLGSFNQNIESYLFVNATSTGFAGHRTWLYGWSLKKGCMELIMTGEVYSEVLCAVYREGVKINK